MSDIRDIFRDSVNDPQPEKKVVTEANKNKKPKEIRKKDQDTKRKGHLDISKGENGKSKAQQKRDKKKRAGTKAGKDYIDQSNQAGRKDNAGTTQTHKDKKKPPRSVQTQIDKRNAANQMGESVSEEALLEDLFNNMEFEEGFEFTEEAVKMMKKAYMSGFLSSTKDNNGKSCRAIYKNSALQPGADVWNKNLRERFNRFIYHEKKKRNEGK